MRPVGPSTERVGEGILLVELLLLLLAVVAGRRVGEGSRSIGPAAVDKKETSENWEVTERLALSHIVLVIAWLRHLADRGGTRWPRRQLSSLCAKRKKKGCASYRIGLPPFVYKDEWRRSNNGAKEESLEIGHQALALGCERQRQQRALREKRRSVDSLVGVKRREERLQLEIGGGQCRCIRRTRVGCWAKEERGSQHGVPLPNPPFVFSLPVLLSRTASKRY